MDPNMLPEQMAKMSPAEREKLAKKLDDDLEAYIAGLEASASKFQVRLLICMFTCKRVSYSHSPFNDSTLFMTIR